MHDLEPLSVAQAHDSRCRCDGLKNGCCSLLLALKVLDIAWTASTDLLTKVTIIYQNVRIARS